MLNQRQVNLALRISRKGEEKKKRPKGFPQTKDKASREFVKSLNPKVQAKGRRQRRKSGFKKDQFVECLDSLGRLCVSEAQSGRGEPQGGFKTAAMGLAAASAAAITVKGVSLLLETREIALEAVGIINDTMPSVKKAAEGVSSLAQEGVTVNHKIDTSNIFAPIVEQLMSLVGCAGEFVKEHRGAILKVLALLGVVYAFSSGTTLVVIGASALFGAAFGPAAITSFVDYLQKFGDNGVMVPQSGEGDDEEKACLPYLSDLFTFFAGHVATLGKLSISAAALKKLLRDVGSLGRDIRYVKDLYTIVIDFATRVFRCVYKYFTGKECEYGLFGPTKEAYRCINEYHDITVRYNGQEIDVYTYIQLLEECLGRLRTSIHEVDSRSGERTEIISIINRASAELDTAKASVGSGSETRQEPVAVVFAGPPECGKTIVSSFITRLFAFKFATSAQREEWKRNPSKIANGVWNENLCSKYADGHTGQSVHFIDEVTNEPVADDYPLSAKILKYVNTAPLPLTRAELEKKGNDYYRARLLVGTTNCMQWRSPVGVVSPDALYRRVNFFHCTILEKFGKQVSGKTVLSSEEQRSMRQAQKEFNDGKINALVYMRRAFRAIRFVKQDMTASKGQIIASMDSVNDAMTIEDLVSFITEQEKQKSSWYEMNKTTVEQLLGDFDGLMTLFDDSDKESVVTAEESEKPMVAPGKPESGFTDLAERAKNKIAQLWKLGRWKQEPSLEFLEEHKIYLPGGLGQFEDQDYLQNHDTIFNFLNQQGYEFTAVDKLAFRDRQAFVEQYACDGGKFAWAWDYFTPHAEKIRNIRADRHFFSTLVEVMNKINQVNDANLIPTTTALRLAFFAQWFLLTRDFAKYSPHKPIEFNMIEQAIIGAAAGMTVTFSLAFAMGFVSTLLSGDKALQIQSSAPLRRPRRQGGAKVRLVSQGTSYDPVSTVVMNNVYRFRVTGSFVGKQVYSVLVMLQNHVALLSNHVAEQIADAFFQDSEAQIEFLGARPHKCPLSNLFNLNSVMRDADGEFHPYIAYQAYPDTDACLLWVPLGARTILRHFAEFKGVESFLHDRDVVMITRTMSGAESRCAGICSLVSDPEVNALVRESDGSTRQIGNHVVEYNINTQAGDCGSPVVVRVEGNYKVIGIHTSGSNGHLRLGQSVLVCRKTLEDLVKRMAEISTNAGQKLLVESEELVSQSGIGINLMDVRPAASELVSGNYTIATVKRPVMGTKTKIIPSPIHGFTLPTGASLDDYDRAPAVLRPYRGEDGELVDVFDQAMSGYGQNAVGSPHHVLACVNAELMKEFLQFPINPEEKEVLPDWESVVVPPAHLEHVSKIERKTSSGYPMVLAGPAGKKKVIFGEADEYEFTSAEWKILCDGLDEAEKLMLECRRPTLLFMSFLKDERRTKPKHLRPRLVSAASLPMVMLLRKYTLGFVNYMVRNRHRNETAIGTNPFSEWGSVASSLGVRSVEELEEEAALAGDVSGYDKGLYFQVICCFRDLLDRFYDDHGSRAWRIRQALFYELCHSRHVFEGHVIEWLGSNSSGNSLTTPINSYTLLLKIKVTLIRCHLVYRASVEGVAPDLSGVAHALAYPKLFGKRGPFRSITYGDDSIIRLLRNRDRYPWFSFQNVAEQFRLIFGLTYTDDSKASDAVGLKALVSCTFLKRGFGYNAVALGYSREMNCPLALSSIIDSVMWTKTHDENYCFWMQTVQTAFRELSLHDSRVYNYWASKLAKAMTEAGYPTFVPLQEVLQAACRDEDIIM